MASNEQDTIKGMLQALEHMLDQVDRLSVVAGQLVNAQKTGKPLAPSVLNYYDEQLTTLSQQREHFRSVIARWWTLVEEDNLTSSWAHGPLRKSSKRTTESTWSRCWDSSAPRRSSTPISIDCCDEAATGRQVCAPIGPEGPATHPDYP